MIADLPVCLQLAEQGLDFALGPSYGLGTRQTGILFMNFSVYEPCGLGQTISFLLSEAPHLSNRDNTMSYKD